MFLVPREIQNLCPHGLHCLAKDVPTNPSTNKWSKRTVVVKGTTASVLRQGLPGLSAKNILQTICSLSGAGKVSVVWNFPVGGGCPSTGITSSRSGIWGSTSWKVFTARLWVPEGASGCAALKAHPAAPLCSMPGWSGAPRGAAHRAESGRWRAAGHHSGPGPCTPILSPWGPSFRRKGRVKCRLSEAQGTEP